MEIVLDSPLDMHLHLRENEMLATVAPFSAASFAGGVIMPNLVAPVDSRERVIRYREQISKACGDNLFTPYMTLFFKPYSRTDLLAVKKEIIGIKLYPAGITTQSDNGVTDFNAIGDTLTIMEQLQIPLLVHGESNGFVMDREREFLKVYQRLAKGFPKLHIVMEHITTADAVAFVDKCPNVSATVTLHHLMITLDDVIGDSMQPDLFCKPIAKHPHDRHALREAVFSGHDRIMFGSDSAPHPRHKKECCGCAAGIFSAPVALPMLAELFEEAGHLDRLPDFVCTIARTRYGITPPIREVTLTNSPWHVPVLLGKVKPFLSGKKLRWSVKK